jgi:hypothetical protein
VQHLERDVGSKLHDEFQDAGCPCEQQLADRKCIRLETSAMNIRINSSPLAVSPIRSRVPASISS